jgi:hypothetical protein
VKFYVVAILFIVFDVETVFLVPWAVVMREVGVGGLRRGDDLHLHPDGGPDLRVEEGSARMGLNEPIELSRHPATLPEGGRSRGGELPAEQRARPQAGAGRDLLGARRAS